MVPEPSVSNRSNASRISCFCSSVRPEERPLPLSRRAEPTACERRRDRARGGAMGVASATVRREGEAKRKKRRALKPRKAGSTDVPVRTNGAVERRSSELRKSARDARRGEPSRATRVRFARANAVIDAVGSDSRRFARRFASRARVRAVRRPPNIGQQRISRFKLQIEARGKRQRERGRARAERRHRSAASERAPARRIARRHSRARAVGRGRASRASRGPARGRMARRYATREGSSAQIPAMSRVCRIATRARASIAPAAPRRAERALRGIRERDAPL